jgi:hypothetical protein
MTTAFCRVDQHARIHKLVREQGVILVVKAGFQLDGPCGGINLVIEAQQRPFAQLLFVGTVPGFDLKFARLFAPDTVAMSFSGRVNTRSMGWVWVMTTIPVVSLLEI